MSTSRQVGAVVGMSLQSLPQRWGSSSVIVIGMAGVVGVLLGLLAMVTGALGLLRDRATASVERGCPFIRGEYDTTFLIGYRAIAVRRKH